MQYTFSYHYHAESLEWMSLIKYFWVFVSTGSTIFCFVSGYKRFTKYLRNWYAEEKVPLNLVEYKNYFCIKQMMIVSLISFEKKSSQV